MINIRREVPADAPVIARIVQSAFSGHPHSVGTEAAIVRALRTADALSVSLVAEVEGQVRGYIAASIVQIDVTPSTWHGLGPVAIDPPHQRKGLGSLLIAECLAQLRKLGAAGCVVLGEPTYYGRFGFKASSKLVYPEVPPEYFMALPFGAATPQGDVTYHAAFSLAEG